MVHLRIGTVLGSPNTNLEEDDVSVIVLTVSLHALKKGPLWEEKLSIFHSQTAATALSHALAMRPLSRHA